MKRINFVTTNDRKIGEAKLACDQFGIEIKQIKFNFVEIQSDDPKQIAINKAEQAYLKNNYPVVVTDTFWDILALNGFPGAYMKYTTGWFGPDDFLNLMKGKTDRRISFTETVVYKDDAHVEVFSKEFWGIVVDSPRGQGNSIEQIVEFDGFTLGERRDQKTFSHEAEEYVWWDFAKWYSELEESVL